MEREGSGTVINARATPRTRASGLLARVFVDTDDHELVQRRLGLLYGVLGGIIATLFAVAFVAVAFVAPKRLLDVHTSLPKVVHVLSTLILFGAWWMCRGKLRSRLLLSLVDAFALFKVMVLVGVVIVFAPPTLGAEALALGPFLLIVMLRAAIVPSPPRWTLFVTALASLPVPVGMMLVAKDRDFGTVGVLPAPILPLMGLVWSATGTFAAWLISRVVYGLRLDVRNAMKLGQYTLEEKIGEGGMGVVWRARHALLRRPTAIKLLSPDRTDDASVKRFEREVQITSSLTHPNTVAIYDFGRTRSGVFYYAMELLDGVTLQELVEEDGPQPPARVVHILVQVANALAEAHDVGLVHRDVKPANVFLCERGGMPDFAKVLDFGLVKDQGHPDPGLSTANAIAGTPLYMSPESITNPDGIDGRVDLYALGAVAYWLLAGRPPFEGANLVEICSHHLHSTPKSPAEASGLPIPPPLDALVLRCLAKRAEDRPPSAHALAAELEGMRGVCGRWEADDARAWWQAHPARPNGLSRNDDGVDPAKSTYPAEAAQERTGGGANAPAHPRRDARELRGSAPEKAAT